MEIIIELILDLIEAALLLMVFQIFMNEKRFVLENKLKSAAFCIILALFLFWSSTNITMVYHVLFNVIFSILLLTFFTRINIFSAATVYFILLIIIMVTEMSLMAIGMLIFNLHMEELIKDQNYMLFFTVLTKSLQILITVLLYRFNLSIKRFRLFSKESSVYSNFIISIGVFGIFILAVSFSKYDVKNMVMYNIMLFGFYIAFFILSLRDLRERDKLLSIKNKYNIQEYQIKNMEQIISIIREEKHDYANHINVIQALCTLNKPNTVERIKDYVSNISDAIHSSFRYLNTGNDYIDGLLSIKNAYALKTGIDFEAIINEPFSSLEIKADELISIVSNLVDNAFEAFQDGEVYENKKVFFKTDLYGSEFKLQISNNGAIIPKDIITAIFKKGFSTKVGKGLDHGFGLFITKELVEKNHGQIFVESDYEKTTFSVIFDLKKVG